MTPAARLPPVDVCVVGAGPAGLAATLALSRAGRSVILVESGGVEPSPEAQELNAGPTVGEPYVGLQSTRHRGLGGTVNIWNVEIGTEPGAKYAPLSPRDLRAWPIDFEELVPWYGRAQELIGLGPFAYGPDPWTTASRRPFDLGGTGLTTGVYQFGSARRFTHELVDDVRAREGVTVLTGCTVVGLVAGRSTSSLRGVRIVGPDGGVVVAGARAVILACGAVENARQLLLHGVPEESGWLGRGFMEHARDFALVLEPFDRGVFRRAGFYDLHRGQDGTVVGGHLGLTPEAREEHDLLNAALTLVPFPRLIPGDGLLARARRWVMTKTGRYWSGRYGWSEVEAPERVFDTFGMIVNVEQLPRRENRITLGGPEDRFGNPLPRLYLRWSDEEQEKLERFRRLLGEWFHGAGLGRLSVPGARRPDLGAHHHAGTTRMGADPSEGVVDPTGRVFGVDNLFVAGASVFPTAGFANPTLTIVAMALRLASAVDRALS